jgi:glycosyltransferase involved in cell wall biosynthesis
VFRYTPWFLDRLLDATPLLRAVGRLAASTRPETLGPMTFSVLKAERGAQRKELEKLIVALERLQPDVVCLPNLMFVGFAKRLKDVLGARVVCGLAGEDVFLDRLPEPFRDQVFELIAERANDVDAFIALTEYYAEHATRHFSLPAERVHKTTMGVRVADFGSSPSRPAEPFTIGYLARICPEKGLAELCEAFIRLRQAGKACRLRVAGYLGSADQAYFERVVSDLRQAGVDSDAFEYVGEVTRNEKIRFLRSLHVLSVPTTYAESKGFYVLEALAAGVPVVLPTRGSFPELIEATGGGLLCNGGDPQALADGLALLIDDPQWRDELGARGRDAVRALFTAERIAGDAWRLFDELMHQDAGRNRVV